MGVWKLNFDKIGYSFDQKIFNFFVIYKRITVDTWKIQQMFLLELFVHDNIFKIFWILTYK